MSHPDQPERPADPPPVTSRHRGRPRPEDAGKPESPTKLTKPSWKYIARKTLREFSDDQCTDLAAALTYYAVLALFPALLALVSLLGLFGQAGQDRSTDRRALRHGRRVRRRHHQRTAASNSPRTPPPGLALVIGIAGALWSASGYVGCVRPGDEPDLRNPGGPPVLETPPTDDRHHPGRGHPRRPGRDRPGGVRARRPGHRRGHRAGRHRGHHLGHREMAGAARAGRRGGGDPVLRHPEHASNPNSGGSASAPSSRSSPGSSRPPCSASTSPSSPTTTRPTAPSPG